jgi:hypothetical protein
MKSNLQYLSTTHDRSTCKSIYLHTYTWYTAYLSKILGWNTKHKSLTFFFFMQYITNDFIVSLFAWPTIGFNVICRHSQLQVFFFVYINKYAGPLNFLEINRTLCTTSKRFIIVYISSNIGKQTTFLLRQWKSRGNYPVKAHGSQRGLLLLFKSAKTFYWTFRNRTWTWWTETFPMRIVHPLLMYNETEINAWKAWKTCAGCKRAAEISSSLYWRSIVLGYPWRT